MRDTDIFDPITLITETAKMAPSAHGSRAKCLQRLVRLDMPVPTTVALSFDEVRRIGRGEPVRAGDILCHFEDTPLLSVRPSSESADWGGPGAILNIGMNAGSYATLKETIGEGPASELYLSFIHVYATHVARLDPDDFEDVETPDAKAVDAALKAYELEADEPFPQDVSTQLATVLRSMARAWDGTTARILRTAKGAPEDAGLGLVVQKMALGVGPKESGSGVIQFADSQTGLPGIYGRYLSQSQGRDALKSSSRSLYLTKDPRGPSLEESHPSVFSKLLELGDISRSKLREEMEIEFTLDAGELSVLDALRIQRSSAAAVQIAVDLAKSKVIPRAEALMRIEPMALSDLLHRQVAPDAKREVVLSGIAASPGAACGKLVFSSTAALLAAGRGEDVVLARRETGPEDIRGMGSSVAVLTEKGGVTSHAAVIGRGMGLPCVVGMADAQINHKDRTIATVDGTLLKEGDLVTVDGSSGDVLRGQAAMVEAALDSAMQELLDWADDERDIQIRANADTPQDAKAAAKFKASGIGLCRTEHMFFDEDRLSVMHEMIFAETPQDRRAALDRLLPMQKADFKELFDIMGGKPVCIRLLDPPLHEFLPSDRAGMRDLAEVLDLPLAAVLERVEQLTEYNPMLGLRGVRLGITVPEIYDMQAQAIFEAAIECGTEMAPEIMIPLVSAQREVELVKTRIDSVAASVRTNAGHNLVYSLGVMVETPRAALRAGDISGAVDFLSFGTNDLTQMTYGLSRDDAGRFMASYIQQGVFQDDPFKRIDTEGVGELLDIGAKRGKETNPDVVLSVCGEHGGDPETVGFLRSLGVDCVSCSPYRVPIAKLAAAQIAISDVLSEKVPYLARQKLAGRH